MYLKINWSVKMFDKYAEPSMGVARSGLWAPGCVVLFNTFLHISNEMPSLEFIYRSQAPVIDIFLQRMWDKKCIT